MHPRTKATADAVELLVALITISRQVKARAAEDGDHCTSVMLLQHVTGGNSLRLSDLAGCAGLDHSTVSRHVKRLEDAGFIARAEDPLDRRASRLVITPQGRAVLDEAMRARAAVLEEVIAGWPEADRHTLADLTVRLAAALERTTTGENPA